MNNSAAYPIFKSLFLASIVESIKKRSKSIKHNVSSFNLQKVIEKSDEKILYEKLETEFILQKKITVRLFFWEDRWSWIDVRESKQKRWIFEWEAEGRIGSIQSQEVVEALQNTFSLAVAHNKVELDRVWSAVILTGPQRP